MRTAISILLVALLAATAGCSNIDEVTLGGPSVKDQLNSRGYIATPSDTVMPVDTLGRSLDSLGRE